MALFLEYARSTNLFRELCQQFVSPDGNLLESTDDRTAEAQVEFLRWAIHLAQPQAIIETGTNKGFFGYFLSLIADGVVLHTFDLNPQAEKAVRVLNEKQTRVTCVFYPGDSRVALPRLNIAVQFAWIDGGHDEDIPLVDLLECYRLRVPWVAVDDTVFPAVRKAVEHLVSHMPYTIVPNPFSAFDRRQAILLRLDEVSHAEAIKGL